MVALPVPAAIEAGDRQSAIRPSGYRIVLAGLCHLHSDVCPASSSLVAVTQRPVSAAGSVVLFDDDRAVHVRMDRADIFVGARLIEDKGVLFAAIEAL
jgi:hypothetical protein